MEIKPRAVKAKAGETADEADADVGPLELEVAQVDIPAELVSSLKASKQVTKGRFGR